MEFLTHLQIGQSKFEKNTGLANGLINNIKRNISTKSLNKISSFYPQLNTAWLLTGEGEMLLSETKTGPDPEKELLRKRVQDLETIVELQKQIINSKGESQNQSIPSEKLRKAR